MSRVTEGRGGETLPPQLLLIGREGRESGREVISEGRERDGHRREEEETEDAGEKGGG